MIFLIFLFIIIIGSSIIRGILGLIFGRRSSRQPYGQYDQAGQSQQSTRQGQQSQSKQSAPSGGKSREKIFDKSDGEYVDFEEIKE